MRSLPPPRRSRARWLRRLLHKFYHILTLEFLFHKSSTITIKRRRTPFHRSSKKYKVKLPKRQKFSFKHPFKKRVLATQVLNKLTQDLTKNVVVNEGGTNVYFKSIKVGRRSRVHQKLSRDKRALKSMLRKLFWQMHRSKRRSQLYQDASFLNLP